MIGFVTPPTQEQAGSCVDRYEHLETITVQPEPEQNLTPIRLCRLAQASGGLQTGFPALVRSDHCEMANGSPRYRRTHRLARNERREEELVFHRDGTLVFRRLVRWDNIDAPVLDFDNFLLLLVKFPLHAINLLSIVEETQRAHIYTTVENLDGKTLMFNPRSGPLLFPSVCEHPSSIGRKGSVELHSKAQTLASLHQVVLDTANEILNTFVQIVPHDLRFGILPFIALPEEDLADMFNAVLASSRFEKGVFAV